MKSFGNSFVNGVSLNDLTGIEVYFEVSIDIYELMENKGAKRYLYEL